MLESYHKYECGNKDLFGKILDNMKKDGKTRIGSTKDMSKLCYRVRYKSFGDLKKSFSQAIAQKPVSWYRENKESISAECPKFGDKTYDKARQHSLFNLVSHHDRIKTGSLLWFLISAVCHLRVLQLSGYFGAKKLKV